MKKLMTLTLKLNGGSLFICKKEEIIILVINLLIIGILSTYSGKNISLVSNLISIAITLVISVLEGFIILKGNNKY